MQPTRLSPDVFQLSYQGREYLYGYKSNTLRALEEGLEGPLEYEPHPPRREARPLDLEGSITIGTTSTCNLRCTYCHVSGGEYQQSLSEEQVGAIKRLIAKALAKHPETFDITFHSDGEAMTAPALMEQFMDYVDAIKGSTRAYYTLITNATLMHDGNLDLIKRFAYIQVSLDGVPDVNDQTRLTVGGHGSSGLVERGIKAILAARCNLSFRATLTRQSLLGLKDFIDYLADLCQPHEDSGLSLSVEPFYEGERSTESLDHVDPDVFVDTFLAMKAYARTRNVYLSSPLAKVSKPGNAFCSAVGGAVFTPSGLVTSCTRVTRQDNANAERYIYGRFNPETNEYQVDQSKYSKLQELREVPEDCMECPALTLCGGSMCYLEKNEHHCSIRSRLLLVERLRLGGHCG